MFPSRCWTTPSPLEARRTVGGFNVRRFRMESQDQLTSVASILKAFPNVEIKIGGYTDNTGDKAANMKLSADRAATVVGELVKMGIDPKRLSSEGYGDAHPVADNGTEEGRQKNRRVSMSVTKK